MPCAMLAQRSIVWSRMRWRPRAWISRRGASAPMASKYHCMGCSGKGSDSDWGEEAARRDVSPRSGSTERRPPARAPVDQIRCGCSELCLKARRQRSAESPAPRPKVCGPLVGSMSLQVRLDPDTALTLLRELLGQVARFCGCRCHQPGVPQELGGWRCEALHKVMGLAYGGSCPRCMVSHVIPLALRPNRTG